MLWLTCFLRTALSERDLSRSERVESKSIAMVLMLFCSCDELTSLANAIS